MGSEPVESLRTRVLRGAAWSVAMRWSIRLIGVISTIILARLLTPADFGIVAMAMLVVGLVGVLFELGVNIYLIQKIDADDDDYSTAWTVRLLQGAVATTLLVASTPLAVDYFSTPKLMPVLWCLSVLPLVSGLENIGIVKFQKNLELGKDFRFLVLNKVVGFVVTIASAALLRNYWALVIGVLSAAVFGMVASYVIHPFRPRLTLCRVRTMLSFSTWLLIRNIGGYAQSRIDQLIVGGRADAGGLGVYTMASDLAEMPTSEVLTPMGRALLPGLATIKTDLQRTRKAFARVFGLLLVLACPLTVGMALVAEDVVHVLLGAKWSAVVEPLRVLAFVGFLLSLRYTASVLLNALGAIRLVTVCVWIQVVLFVLLCAVFFTETSLVEIAYIRLGLAALITLVVLGQTVRLRLFRLSDLLRGMARPFLGCAAMAAAVLTIQSAVSLSPLIDLLLQVAAGGAVYCAVLLGSWWAAGRPDSAESEVMEMIGTKLFGRSRAASE